MLHEVEGGVKAAQAFLRRSFTLQPDCALRGMYKYVEDLDDAGYTNIQIARDFREE